MCVYSRTLRAFIEVKNAVNFEAKVAEKGGMIEERILWMRCLTASRSISWLCCNRNTSGFIAYPVPIKCT